MKLKQMVTLAVVITVVVLTVFFIGFRETKSEAYIYLPEGARVSYTDIPMFDCSWCHRTNRLNRHHIVPQSANPALKNDFGNIIVLCRDCHFVLGHRCNWKRFNPDVVEICTIYTNVVVSKQHFNEIQP